MIIEYIKFVSIVFLIIYTFISIKNVYVNNKNKESISNKIKSFESYISVLEYYMLKSYDIIYKDRILIYSIEATKIDDKDFGVISKDFAYLTLKLMGNNLKKEYIELYGSEETLMFNMIEYFNNKFENDEIRDKAKESIMNSDLLN